MPNLSLLNKSLISSIKDVEGHLGLKRARLLREADAMHTCSFNGAGTEPSDSTEQHTAKSPNKDLAEPLDPSDVEVETLEDPRFHVGSKCRFRHTDGHWYAGEIVDLEESRSATVSFLTPM